MYLMMNKYTARIPEVSIRQNDSASSTNDDPYVYLNSGISSLATFFWCIEVSVITPMNMTIPASKLRPANKVYNKRII